MDCVITQHHACPAPYHTYVLFALLSMFICLPVCLFVCFGAKLILASTFPFVNQYTLFFRFGSEHVFRKASLNELYITNVLKV